MKTTNDTQAITRRLDAVAAAWNDGDAEAFAACFTHDADYITYAGQHVSGREEIADIHRQLFNSFMKGSKLIYQSSHVRFLAPDIALVHAVGTTQMRWQKKAPKNRASINTNVAVKTDDGWKIAAFHNSRIKTNGLLMRLARLFSK